MHAQNHDAQAHASAVALATTARNLQFLALIETTIDVVSSDTEHVRVCARTIEKCMNELHTEFKDAPLTEEARFIELLDKTLDTARRIHQDAKKRHESACNDKMLTPDDGVADVFEELIQASDELFDCASEFKDWIETHNALLEPTTGKTYASVDELMGALNAD